MFNLHAALPQLMVACYRTWDTAPTDQPLVKFEHDGEERRGEKRNKMAVVEGRMAPCMIKTADRVDDGVQSRWHAASRQIDE